MPSLLFLPLTNPSLGAHNLGGEVLGLGFWDGLGVMIG